MAQHIGFRRLRGIARSYRDVVADRLLLLAALRDAGFLLISVVGVVLALMGLLPAATAVAMGFLISRFDPGSNVDDRFTAALAPCAAFAVLLLLGHVLDALLAPLAYLTKSRIDGAHRARVAHLAAASATIAALEDSKIQDLIRIAKADPDNWTERTPGDGAVSQFALVARYLGMFFSCAVIAAFSGWLIPLVVVPSMIGRSIRRRQWVGVNRLWASGVPHGRRGAYWRDVVTGSADAKEVRVLGYGDWAIDRSQRHITDLLRPSWNRTIAVVWTTWTVVPLTVLPLSVAYCWVVIGVVHGHASVAIAAAVLTACWSVYTVFGPMHEAFDIEGAIPVLRAYHKLREVTPKERRANGTAVGTLNPRPPAVRFEDVRFTYPGSNRPVLEGVELEIRPGELLAIVGFNGAGKSTLTKLLAGLYDPTGGAITADGVDIAEIGPADWRRQISVVFQDFVKYELSVADNVRLGQAGLPEDSEALELAARDAGLDVVLDRLPDRWDTPLARSRTDGVDLSGGQWQQVVLARALYAVRRGARILVLDEPTAHLDVRTEFELFQRLVGKAGDTSVVLISHRLSTVRLADRIVVLDGGSITESGSHDELMARGGGYAQMFLTQAELFNRRDNDQLSEAELV